MRGIAAELPRNLALSSCFVSVAKAGRVEVFLALLSYRLSGRYIVHAMETR